MLLKKRRPASHLARKWILFSIGSALRLGFFFVLDFKLISVNMEKAKFLLLHTFKNDKRVGKTKEMCTLDAEIVNSRAGNLAIVFTSLNNL
jgi:hypothetical protein